MLRRGFSSCFIVIDDEWRVGGPIGCTWSFRLLSKRGVIPVVTYDIRELVRPGRLINKPNTHWERLFAPVAGVWNCRWFRFVDVRCDHCVLVSIGTSLSFLIKLPQCHNDWCLESSRQMRVVPHIATFPSENAQSQCCCCGVPNLLQEFHRQQTMTLKH